MEEERPHRRVRNRRGSEPGPHDPARGTGRRALPLRAAKAGGGNILALDATDGSELWRFDTTDEPADDETPSGGAWNTPALDDEGNVYFGVGNGYYSHNTPQKLRLSGSTPKLVWKTPVGTHNGHDDDGAAQLEDGLVLPEIPFDVYPGPYGGVETNMAVSDGVVYAAVVNLPGHVKTPADLDKPVLPVDFKEGTGAIVALDLATGEVKWQSEIDQMPFGAMTASNDLVFTTTFDGKLRAYSTADGTEVWTSELGAGTNSLLAIAGDTLVAAAGFPQGADQKAQLVVYKLNAGR